MCEPTHLGSQLYETVVDMEFELGKEVMGEDYDSIMTSKLQEGSSKWLLAAWEF